MNVDSSIVVDIDIVRRPFRDLRIRFKPAAKKRRPSQSTSTLRRCASAPHLPTALDDRSPTPDDEFSEDDVDVSDYRGSDMSQDEMLVDWTTTNRLRVTSGSLDDVRRVAAAAPDGPEPPAVVKPHFRYCAVNPPPRELRRLRSSHTKRLRQFSRARDCLPAGAGDSDADDVSGDDDDDEKRVAWIWLTHEMAADQLTLEHHRLFAIHRSMRPRRLEARLRLGYCVRYAGECGAGADCRDWCVVCGVCSHQYACTCRLTRRHGWCNHLHLAVRCGRHRFGDETLVYVHNSSRLMQLAHLRAACYDAGRHVRRLARGLFAVREYQPWARVVGKPTTEYRVWRLPAVSSASERSSCCPAYKRCPLCDICRHLYRCTCDDYRFEKLLCEHCHAVAIFERPNQFERWFDDDFRYRTDVPDDVDEWPDSSASSDDDERRSQRAIRANHEKSLSIPSSQVVMTSLRGPVRFWVMAPGGEKRAMELRPATTPCDCLWRLDVLMCTGCHVCPHSFWCPCAAPPATTVCRHVHALCRYLRTTYALDADRRTDDSRQTAESGGGGEKGPRANVVDEGVAGNATSSRTTEVGGKKVKFLIDDRRAQESGEVTDDECGGRRKATRKKAKKKRKKSKR